MTTRQAACSCGKVQVTTNGEPFRISMCHCLDCQRRTGSVFGAQAWFSNDHVSIQGPTARFLRKADSGNEITYHFCSSCGATVYYRPHTRLDTTAIPIGAFADPSFPPPRVSVYEARQHPWVATPDDVEHLD